jgi:hypothetical protein
VVLLIWYAIGLLEPQTHMSRLDRQWLKEFFNLFSFFLLAINFVFIMPFLLEEPKLLAFVSRLLFGAIGACIAHLQKGFALYDDLT